MGHCGLLWPLPWQPAGLAEARRAGARGCNITRLECTGPPLPKAWGRVSTHDPA